MEQHISRFGSIANCPPSELHKPGHEHEGKFDSSERFDSGIDSYIPSYDSTDSRTNSLQQYDVSRFESLTVTDSTQAYKSDIVETSIDGGYESLKSLEGVAFVPVSKATEVKKEPVLSPNFNQLHRVFAPDTDGDTYLQLAIIQKNVGLAFDIIEWCIDSRFLDVANCNQQTALHLSVITDQPEITRGLVAFGADVRCKDNRGNTPLHLACELGLLTQVKMLSMELEKQENPGKQLLTIPQCLNEHNYFGLSPLHLAVVNNHKRIVDELVNTLKCDINQPDLKSGRTALHHSVECDFLEITMVLLKAGAYVNALTYDDCAALHFAAARGFKKEAEVLLHYNADIFLITRDDYDVFELSELSKNQRMVAYLRKKEDERRQREEERRRQKKALHYRSFN